MFVKIIDKNNIKMAPNPIHIGDYLIANPSDIQLLQAGYKPLVYVNEIDETTTSVVYSEDSEKVYGEYVSE